MRSLLKYKGTCRFSRLPMCEFCQRRFTTQGVSESSRRAQKGYTNEHSRGALAPLVLRAMPLSVVNSSCAERALRHVWVVISRFGDLKMIQQHEPDVYSLPRAARRLGISPQTLRRWISQGELSALRVGGCVRVPRTEVEGLLARAETRRRP